MPRGCRASLNVLPKPANFSFEEAAGLLFTGCTPVHALKVTDVAAGDNVLIHGAAGGVGLMAVQLAVEAGARVIGTAGEPSHAYLRDLGAEPVPYGEGLVEDGAAALAPQGVDVAIDTVGTDEAVDSSLWPSWPIVIGSSRSPLSSTVSISASRS